MFNLFSQKTFNQSPTDVNYLSFDKIILPDTLCGDDPIEVLDLPIRLENPLKRRYIFTVGEFYNYPEKEFLKIRNVGSKSLKFYSEVKKRITEKFGILNDTKSTTPIFKSSGKGTTEVASIPQNQLIPILLERCGFERDKDIVKRRYGLETGESETLGEIGDSYGLTRERIRQIQEKALKRMKHPSTKAKKPLMEMAEKLLYKNGGIMTEEEVDLRISEDFKDIAVDGSSLFDLLGELKWIQSYLVGDMNIYSPCFGGIPLSFLTDEILSTVKETNILIDVPSIVRKISFFRKISDERFDPCSFVIRYCGLDPRIEEIEHYALPSEGGNPREQTGTFRYYKKFFQTKGWIELMTKILEEEQIPLHFTEITNKVNDLFVSDRKLDIRRALSILIESDVFAHSGIRGTYGLTSWGLRKDTTVELILECLKKAGFPLHWKQIYNYVSKYKDTKPGNIISVLKINKAFKEVNNGIYWFDKEGKTS